MATSNTNVGIALILSAQNQASAVLNDFFSRTEAKMKALGQGAAKIGEGMAEVFAAKKGLDALKQTTDAYGDMEAAGNMLKATMMAKGGIYDAQMYEKLFQYSKKLSAANTGSAASYLDMIRVFNQNRIDPKDILGGIGADAAMLAHYFDNMNPAATAEFASHMKNDMKIGADKMYEVMNLTAKMHDLGIGKSGTEAVTEINQFFSKVGLSMSNLRSTGLENSKQMAALGSLFMARGLSGQSVGTNIRRIEDGLLSGEKLKKANEVAKYFHKQLQFNDSKGKFLGITNFVEQIEKLQNLNPSAIEAILKPFSGKQGLSTDFMQYLANGGANDYKERIERIDKMGDLRDKMAVVQSGQKLQEAVLKSNVTNTMASFGAAISAPYKKLLEVLNRVMVALGGFLDAHPKIAKYAATFIAISSAAIGMMGIIKVIQGITMVARVLNITMAMNPVLLIATAIAAAAYLIWDNWDAIKTFFINLWGKTKAIFSQFWGWLKDQWWFKYSPVGMIATNWTKIVTFFTTLWDAVKKPFAVICDWIKYYFFNFSPLGLVIKHWEGVKHFFSALWEGVKFVFSKWWDWAKWMFNNMTPVGLIYKHWEGVKHFFSVMWEGVKYVFVTVWTWIAKLCLNFTPVGLIYKYWTPIVNFFSHLWEQAKAPFIAIYDWVMGWGHKFYEAGANIITSIINGIKSKIQHIKDTMGTVATAIRAYLPFSPAKEGALRDIHQIKLVETIAASIKPDAVVAKMREVAAAMREAFAGGMGQMHSATLKDWAQMINALHGSAAVTMTRKVQQMQAVVYEPYIRPLYTIPQFAAISSGSLMQPEHFSKFKPMATYTPDGGEPRGFNGGKGPISFHLEVHLNGSATPADAKMLGGAMQDQFEKWYNNLMRNKQRVGFGG